MSNINLVLKKIAFKEKQKLSVSKNAKIKTQLGLYNVEEVVANYESTRQTYIDAFNKIVSLKGQIVDEIGVLISMADDMRQFSQTATNTYSKAEEIGMEDLLPPIIVELAEDGAEDSFGYILDEIATADNHFQSFIDVLHTDIQLPL